MEASVRDDKFWNTLKDLAQLDRLVSVLLLHENRQPVRRSIAQNMAVVCGVSNLPKKTIKPNGEGPTTGSESLVGIDVDVLATIWGAFVNSFPETFAYAHQCQEFFEVALAIFCSVAEKSPRDLVFNDY